MNQNIANGTYNINYVSIVVKKTDDYQIDAQLKRFCNATRNFLKETREKYKKFLEGMSSVVKASENKPVTKEMVDSGIKYDYQTTKSETVIKCFMNYEAMENANSDIEVHLTEKDAKKLGITPGVMLEESDKLIKLVAEKKMNTFFELIGTPVKTDKGVGFMFDAERYGINSLSTEVMFEKIDEVLSKRAIYQYLKNLDIFKDVQAMIEAEVDYSNVLLIAADAFSEKLKTDTAIAKSCIFNNGNILISGVDGDDFKKEYIVQKDYLMDEPDKMWYVNFREIAIKPYESLY